MSDIISNVAIQRTLEDDFRLYAKTVPFYIKDLSIHGFWASKAGEGSWNQSPAGN